MRLSVAAAAFLAAASCGAAERSPLSPSSTEPVAGLIVALGDSLTAGPGIPADQTYPAVLQRRLDAAGYSYRVVNAGVSGDTTTGALARYEAALVPGTRVLILALGANDGLRGVPIGTIGQNLSSIIELATARGIRVLLCGMETPPSHGLQYSMDFHFLFPRLAEKYRLPLVPFMLQGVIGRPDLTLPDGVHPNAQGAAVIAANIYPYLLPLLMGTLTLSQ